MSGPRFLLSQPLELLTVLHRPIRRPLQGWIKTLHGRLDAVESNDPLQSDDCLDAIVTCFNQLALIELHAGRVRESRAVCTAQLEWIRRIDRRAPSHGFLHLAVQPLINLARLDRICSCYDEAIAKLDLLREAMASRPVSFGELHITANGWAGIRARFPMFDGFLFAAWCTETLNTLLRAGRFAEIDALTIDHLQAGVPDALAVVGDEAALIARCELGAVTLASRSNASNRAVVEPQRLAMELRLAQYETSRDGIAGVAARLRRLTTTATAAEPPAGLEGVHLAVLRQLVVTHRACGNGDLANTVAERGYVLATAVSDEVGRAVFARDLSAQDEGGRWTAVVQELAPRSWYAGVRRLGWTNSDGTNLSHDLECASALQGFTSRLGCVAARQVAPRSAGSRGGSGTSGSPTCPRVFPIDAADR